APCRPGAAPPPFPPGPLGGARARSGPPLPPPPPPGNTLVRLVSGTGCVGHVRLDFDVYRAWSPSLRRRRRPRAQSASPDYSRRLAAAPSRPIGIGLCVGEHSTRLDRVAGARPEGQNARSWRYSSRFRADRCAAPPVPSVRIPPSGLERTALERGDLRHRQLLQVEGDED